MARTFCTVKQAAVELEMTEAQIETLLEDGTLREFRDGPNRLLKVTDLPIAAEIKLPWTAAVGTELPVGAAHPAARSAENKAARQSEHGLPAASWDGDPITAALLSVPVQRPRRSARQTGGGKKAARAACKPAGARCRRRHSRVSMARTRRRQQAQAREMPFRQWIWMGLLDDEPFAILLLLGGGLLGLGFAAGAIYLLMQAL